MQIFTKKRASRSCGPSSLLGLGKLAQLTVPQVYTYLSSCADLVSSCLLPLWAACRYRHTHAKGCVLLVASSSCIGQHRSFTKLSLFLRSSSLWQLANTGLRMPQGVHGSLLQALSEKISAPSDSAVRFFPNPISFPQGLGCF